MTNTCNTLNYNATTFSDGLIPAYTYLNTPEGGIFAPIEYYLNSEKIGNKPLFINPLIAQIEALNMNEPTLKSHLI